MQTERVSTTRWNSSTTEILYSSAGAFHQRPALKVVVKPSLQHHGIQKRLKDTRVIMGMEFLKVVYRRMGSASRLLQGATIHLAAATVLRNGMKEVKMFEAECGS